MQGMSQLHPHSDHNAAGWGHTYGSKRAMDASFSSMSARSAVMVASNSPIVASRSSMVACRSAHTVCASYSFSRVACGPTHSM